MLKNPNDVHVIGSTFIDVAGDNHNHYANKNVLRVLQNHVATGAFHNSAERFDPPKCHPQTRVTILNQIQNWYRNPDPSSPRLMWLYGPAGVGKSAIAQTTAEKCQELGMLAACFFFSRMFLGRNDASRLITTIVYQIALAIPTTISHIQSALERDPLIFSKTMDTQLCHLIIDPILAIVPDETLDRKLIIIDGLDECNDRTAQSNIIRCFASAMMDRDLRLSILILSRPEQPIRDAFSGLRRQCGEYVSTVLGDDYADNEDVERYLRDSFEEICSTHTMKRYIPDNWPEDHDIQTLVWKASGQFIFASTVVRYVRCVRHRPMDRLRDVLAIRTTGQQDPSPFEELDALYMHILRSVDNAHRPIILQFFGFLLVGQDNVIFETMDAIEILLGLQPRDLELALTDCHSIIKITEHPNNTTSAEFFHASISDFFIDYARSREFFLDWGTVHAHLCWACMAGALSPVVAVRSYSLRFLIYHTQNAHIDETLLLALLSFDFSCFLDSKNTLTDISFCILWGILRWLQQQAHDRQSDVKEDLLQHQMRAIKSVIKHKFLSYPHHPCENLVRVRAFEEIVLERRQIYTKYAVGLDRTPVGSAGFRRLPTSETHKDILQFYMLFLHDEEFAGQYHISSEVYVSVALEFIQFILSSYDMVDPWRRGISEMRQIIQEAIPSFLSSAAPNYVLASVLTQTFGHQCWTSVETLNSARTQYLERYETWKAQQWQEQQASGRWEKQERYQHLGEGF